MPFITQQVVGCDGILGSLKVEDQCLRCLKPGEADGQCVGFSGTFTPNTQVTGEARQLPVIPRSLFVHVYRCTISSTVYAHTIRGGLATTNSNLRFTFCLQWYTKAKELQKGRGLGKRQYLSSILCHVQFEISGCYITVIVCAYKASLMVHACMYDADTESCTLPGQPKCNPTD